MNSVKLWVIFKTIYSIVMTICITYASCYFNSWGILFFLLIPMIGMSMDVSSTPHETKQEDKKDVK